MIAYVAVSLDQGIGVDRTQAEPEKRDRRAASREPPGAATSTSALCFGHSARWLNWRST